MTWEKDKIIFKNSIVMLLLFTFTSKFNCLSIDFLSRSLGDRDGKSYKQGDMLTERNLKRRNPSVPNLKAT